MNDVSDTIVFKRLVRNLQYRLTYVQVFEEFLKPDPGLRVRELLQALIDAQKAAAAPLSRYLKSLGADVEDLPPNRRLLEHATRHHGIGPRLRFIRVGLTREVSWYKTQLLDKQMTADPELRQILFELGQAEAAKLWRVEVVMGIIGIDFQPAAKTGVESAGTERKPAEGWQPRLVEELRRPGWSRRASGRSPGSSRSSGYR